MCNLIISSLNYNPRNAPKNPSKIGSFCTGAFNPQCTSSHTENIPGPARSSAGVIKSLQARTGEVSKSLYSLQVVRQGLHRALYVASLELHHYLCQIVLEKPGT